MNVAVVAQSHNAKAHQCAHVQRQDWNEQGFHTLQVAVEQDRHKQDLQGRKWLGRKYCWKSKTQYAHQTHTQTHTHHTVLYAGSRRCKGNLRKINQTKKKTWLNIKWKTTDKRAAESSHDAAFICVCICVYLQDLILTELIREIYYLRYNVRDGGGPHQHAVFML